MTEYILIGDSGHGKVVEDCINASGSQVVAKLDDKYEFVFQKGSYLQGPLSTIKQVLKDDRKVIISIGNNIVREKIVERLQLKEKDYGVVIHPSAIISPTAKIGFGTVVMPKAVVNADSIIGDYVILNTGSIVEHDCQVHNYVHISPNAVLTGGVKVCEGTHVGANSVVNPLVKIGKWSIVGSGSVVIRNITDYVTAVGVPAKVIKKEGF